VHLHAVAPRALRRGGSVARRLVAVRQEHDDAGLARVGREARAGLDRGHQVRRFTFDGSGSGLVEDGTARAGFDDGRASEADDRQLVVASHAADEVAEPGVHPLLLLGLDARGAVDEGHDLEPVFALRLDERRAGEPCDDRERRDRAQQAGGPEAERVRAREGPLAVRGPTS